MTVKDLVHTLIEVVAFNGNVLLNVGPGHDGTINPIFIDRLLGIGKLQILLKNMFINPIILINSQQYCNFLNTRRLDKNQWRSHI
jgi:hypothetical protein